MTCPLCARARTKVNKRYTRGDGLRQHLDRCHEHERAAYGGGGASWHEATALEADGLGVQDRRSAGGPGTAGVGRRGASYVQRGTARGSGPDGALASAHPGLLAARDGDYDALVGMVRGGWDVLAPEARDAHGATALDWAAGGGHLRCVDLLAREAVAAGGALCRRDGRGPAHWAARHGAADVLLRLLSWEGRPFGDANTVTTNGTTALMLACYGGHVGAAQLLLDEGARLDARNAWDCDAGHFAAMGGDVAACAWLAESHGVRFDRRQKAGHTALHKAADCGQAAAVAYLLQRLTAEEAERVGLCADEITATAPITAPDGTPLTAAQTDRRREKHLPSTLAKKRGHAACADLLVGAGL